MANEKINKAELALNNAINKLHNNDLYLLRVDVNERTIASRIAGYLQEELNELDVDVEYNRDGVDPKRLAHMDLYPDSDDTEAKTVFPDIIVHERGSDNNYLVIELKKDSNTVPREIDENKLQGYKLQLNYKYAFFVELGVKENAGFFSVKEF